MTNGATFTCPHFSVEVKRSKLSRPSSRKNECLLASDTSTLATSLCGRHNSLFPTNAAEQLKRFTSLSATRLLRTFERISFLSLSKQMQIFQAASKVLSDAGFPSGFKRLQTRGSCLNAALRVSDSTTLICNLVEGKRYSGVPPSLPLCSCLSLSFIPLSVRRS